MMNRQDMEKVKGLINSAVTDLDSMESEYLNSENQVWVRAAQSKLLRGCRLLDEAIWDEILSKR